MPSHRTEGREEAASYPERSAAGLWSDFMSFLVRRPAERTHIDVSLPGARKEYDRRVFERLDVSVADNDVLNIHRIGVHAPPDFVWDTWSRRQATDRYWPTFIALPAWQNGDNETGSLLLFSCPALRLFRADLIRRRDVPLDSDPNGARYALYRCSGGYPMGIFAMYVRPRIDADDAIETTQVSFLVAFDFFGRKHWLGTRAVRPVWEPIHSRVTTHVLNRFKAHCQDAYAQAVRST